MKKLALIVIMSMFMLTSAFSQPVIKIDGTDNIMAVKRQVAHSLQYLDIQGKVYLLHIVFTEQIPAKLKGMTYPTPLTDSTQLFRIRIDARLDEIQRLNVLAHEMMHVRQYLSGDLRIVEGKTVWKGKTYPFTHRDPRKVPWEREAHRYDQYLAKVLREMPVEVPLLVASEAKD